MEVTYRPIGTIRSPFQDTAHMPIQPTNDASRPGRVEIDAPFVEGLKDLDGFSHVILLYHLHAARGPELTVTPFLDTVPRGVFATRAPTRPNPIGLSIVELLRIEGHVLHVDHLDVLDGTPLLDLKPYVPEFDHRPECRIGWLEGKERERLSDGRFGA
jgi:tRNA-Thr(GGU) m(6)t(6)A37 methyltransferase TsaA